jgi:hypothetical protein
MRWLREFKTNKYKFMESKQGKMVRQWIFIEFNKNMRFTARRWLHKRINRNRKSNKEVEGEFTITQFQHFLNKKGGLLDHYNIPPNALQNVQVQAQRGSGVKSHLTVSHSTAHKWAVALGLKYSKRKKCYFVDGHDRWDVLKYRNEVWLPKEKDLEIRQYLWLQFTQEEAMQLDIPYVSTSIEEEIKKKCNCFEEKEKKGRNTGRHIERSTQKTAC